MPKLTFAIDDKLWKEFLERVIKKYGTTKKARVELEIAVEEYLERRQIINANS
jgi:hypothetical protein